MDTEFMADDAMEKSSKLVVTVSVVMAPCLSSVVVVGTLGSAADRSVRSVRLKVAGMPTADMGSEGNPGGAVGV